MKTADSEAEASSMLNPGGQPFWRQILSPVLFFFFLVLVWQAATSCFRVPDYLVPSPGAIGAKILGNTGLLLRHTGITMLESSLGFVIGSAIGMLTAIGFCHSKTLELSLYPYAIALKTIPLVALAPLLVLWFGNGILAKIVMAALICYFPAIVNTLKGLRAASPEARDLMDSLSANKWQILTKLRMPTSLPYVFSALKISSTLSVIGAMVAELAGSNQGIGYIILTSSYRLETDMVFAAVACASVGGILFFAAIHFLERTLLYWHNTHIDEV